MSLCTKCIVIFDYEKINYERKKIIGKCKFFTENPNRKTSGGGSNRYLVDIRKKREVSGGGGGGLQLPEGREQIRCQGGGEVWLLLFSS